MATTYAGTLARAAAFALGLLVACGGSPPPPVDEPVARGDARPRWTQNDIEEGMSALGPALLACYQGAVKANQRESGAVTISAAITPDGRVESATPLHSTLSKELTTCLADVVRGARFKAPGVSGVRLSIPLAFELADGGAP
jgi:TonB family protein